MKRARTPTAEFTIERPLVDFRDKANGRGAIFTGSGTFRLVTPRKSGDRVEDLKVRWQILGVPSEAGEVLELRSLTLESAAGSLTDRVVSSGLCRVVQSAFERWLIEDATVDEGWPFEDRELIAHFERLAAAWGKWRASYIEMVRGRVSGPRRGRPPAEDANVALLERAVALGADRSDWLKALESELGGAYTYESLKKKIDRLRRAGWLAEQDGRREAPRPGPRLLEYQARVGRAAATGFLPSSTEARKNEEER